MTDLIPYKWYFIKIIDTDCFRVYKIDDSDYVLLSTLADCKAYVDMFTY